MSRACLLAAVLLASTLPALAKSERQAAEMWAANAANILGSVELRAPRVGLRSTIDAFNATLDDLGYFRSDARVKEREAVLTYRGAGDTRIQVKLKQFDEFTHIKVRCGVAGNEALSRRILEQVYPRL